MLSAEIIRELRDTEAETNFLKWLSALSALFLLSVCSISLVASVMLSIYAKLFSHVLAIRERQRQYTCKELGLP